MRRLKTIAVIGVGLIGGSFAAAMRRAGAAARIVGVDRDGSALERAAALGVIDTAAESASEAAAGADLVFVSVPVRAIGSVLHDVSLGLGPATVVTDAGSTKADVVRTAAHELRDRVARFVPGHPIAGRESSGVESSTPDLFRGARVVLTPEAETSPEAIELVRALLGGLRSAREHDARCGARPHLRLGEPPAAPPRLRARLRDRVAAGLGGTPRLRGRRLPRLHAHRREFAGDVARHCACQPRSPSRGDWTATAARVAVFRELVANGDGPGLQRLMTEARNARRAWSGAKRSNSDE